MSVSLPIIDDQKSVTRKQLFSSRAFTLIELLIVVAILAILFVIILARFGTFGKQVDLNTTSQRIISALQLARNQTLGSEGETTYGVYFESDKYILFKGASYDPSGTENKVYDLTKTEIYDINIIGGSSVVFERVRGTTSTYGSLKVRLLADNTKTQTILINPLGQVSLQEVVTPVGSRITDTRHLHFDLGWTIQGKNTLQLVFSNLPNPDTIENITISNYLSAGVFDWEGTVNVNGSDQTLRIHSHFIDASNTVLSIHRDRRHNDKALQILIDSSDIVSYTADGQATVGFFGGAMTQQ